MQILDCRHFLIDRESAEPLHLQLKQALLAEMRGFATTHPVILPSERELSKQLSLSRPTIHRAYNELLTMGLVRPRRDKSLEILSGSRQKIVGSYRVVGVLLPMDFAAFVEHNHQKSLPYLKGLIGHASKLNMSCLMLRPPTADASPEELDAFLDEHLPRLYGLIHLGAMRQASEDDWVLRRIMERREVPQVCLSGMAYSHIGSVYVDPTPGMEEACAFLQQRGCKSLGVISPATVWPQSPYVDIARYRDETMIKIACNHDMDIRRVVCIDEVAENQQLLLEPQRPDVLFCHNDYIAEQIMAMAHELNVRIPEDLKVLGYDGTYTDGRLASINHPSQQVAAESINMIEELFEQGVNDKNMVRKLNSKFMPGKSI